MTHTSRQAAEAIAESLRMLDRRLRRIVDAVRARTGREPGADPFRGLYVSDSDVRELLDGTRGFPGAEEADVPGLARGPQFAFLADEWNLSSFELDALLIALAPEIDPRYQRIFGYLQDDVSRKWATIDLTLNLLCTTEAERLQKRGMLSAAGSLARQRLIRFSGDDLTASSTREVLPDPRIASFLLGDTTMDASVARFARLVPSDPTEQPIDQGLVNLAQACDSENRRMILYLRGTSETEKRAAAMALAAELKAPLLIADLPRAARSTSDFETWLDHVSREAVLQGAILYREGLDQVAAPEARDAAIRALSPRERIAIFSGTEAWQAQNSIATGVFTIQFESPAWPERRAAWKTTAQKYGTRLNAQTLDSLAQCFRFDAAEIEDAVETAGNIARYRTLPVRPEHIFEAARARSGHELARLTRRITPAHNWNDIVLPDDAMRQLREICLRVTLRYPVFAKWGFGRKLSSGKGVNALFHGHSGTGKTMAAEVIAHELQLDLYKIDLAGVVSKYIGETEKNLDRIFAAAETANAILLFDEADALFGKRSEVRDSHDRYANLEISYLLQKMEQYEGVAILATNLRQNLDDAFLRRLAFSITFPFPDEVNRRRIWEKVWPTETPVGADVDKGWLAAQFLLSGGNIRNVALAAAYLAVEEKGIAGEIGISHVLGAVRAEMHKMGKILSGPELTPPARIEVAA